VAGTAAGAVSTKRVAAERVKQQLLLVTTRASGGRWRDVRGFVGPARARRCPRACW